MNPITEEALRRFGFVPLDGGLCDGFYWQFCFDPRSEIHILAIATGQKISWYSCELCRVFSVRGYRKRLAGNKQTAVLRAAAARMNDCIADLRRTLTA